jgi:DNA-binding MarR family transcriptional regulator
VSKTAANLHDVSYGTTLHVRDHCLCLAARRAARTLSRRFDEAFRPVGLTSGQFSLLMSLNRPEPPTLGSVANLLAMDRTTLTANLKPLERRGLVETHPDPDDRRSRRLVLTDAGRKALGAAVPIWERTQAELARLLAEGGADPEALYKGLRAMT